MFGQLPFGVKPLFHKQWSVDLAFLLLVRKNAAMRIIVILFFFSFILRPLDTTLALAFAATTYYFWPFVSAG